MMFKKAEERNVYIIPGIVAMVAIVGLVAMLHVSSNGIKRVTGSVTGNACDTLTDLYTTQFDCCGAGAGSGKCGGISTSYSAISCGTASDLCAPKPSQCISGAPCTSSADCGGFKCDPVYMCSCDII